ncbi:peptidoglycan editing factor PgeF [Paenibacillus glycanilyticus]|uniref:peptidoglycan editing factor PgeF n=1 Tax=Paenibacillus glycanilyticus TaxID=126569 RepID=UPI00203C85D4|nr:peptidoglycan editing factor PgeF [Paenibacillus glycanilyticus]MCM3626434.1 peptidoglycan editing factor PgeF [Paenibacillus glycanilyticus]
MESFKSVPTAKGPSLFLLPSWMEQNDRLTAGFTGRSGGVSEEPWTSLNVGLHVGDADADVVRNRELIAEAIGWPFEAWTCGEQVHGCEVFQVTEGERGKGRLSRDSAIADTDGLMTNIPGVLLASFYADCVPLYFYDPEHQAVALAHAGWKGTVQQIASRTIEAMGQQYGTRPEQLLCAIGPSISDCCYEVDGFVIDKLQPLVDKLAGKLNSSLEQMMTLVENGKAMVNLKQINRHIMLEAGILPIHIELSEWCTGCSTDQFFSHRKEGGKTGRMASWIGIRER